MQNPTYLTVSALTQYIKYKLENDPHLKKVYLKGEISNFKAHSSGHFYFSIKDDKAQINAMMFSSYAKKISFSPKDGDQVLVEGYISLYEARGQYSISVFSMTLDGIGELFLKYEKLRKEFEALGYFDVGIKKPIPKFPHAIGVITSATGAVIEDIKNTVTRRYLLTKIILYPALVQGDGSKDDLVKKIRQANHDDEVDVIILGRGGGSIEDLWSFNEPEVVMAIFESKIPIITAIGHETDTTLADYVSDLRAPTPTAAAELATPNVKDLLLDIKDKMDRIEYYINESIQNKRQALLHLDERLSLQNPERKFEQIIQNIHYLHKSLSQNYAGKVLDLKYRMNLLQKMLISPAEKVTHFKEKQQQLEKRLTLSYDHLLNQKGMKFEQLKEALKNLNPLTFMEKGFSLTMKAEKVITSIQDLEVDDLLDVTFKDGKVKTKVLEKEGESNE